MGKLSIAIFAFLWVFGVSSDSFAQGNRGGARPNGNPSSGRPSTGQSVDTGIGSASQRSNGRSDDGFGTSSRNSGRRSDDGIDRARLMRENRNNADREIRENLRLQEVTKLTANDLREGYDAALADNPNLKFGQFVAANMIARNLGERYPNVTTSAILAGLNEGDSIGGTLKKLGVSKDEAKRAEKETKRQIKDARK